MAATAGTAPHASCRAVIDFARDTAGITRLARREAGYPLHVGRPFRLDERPAGMATLYLQSVSGGLYAADDLQLELGCGAGAAAHVTTQAPTVVHATGADAARQRVSIDAAPGAWLEYLPETNVLLPGAALASRIDARLEGDAVALFSDGFLAHDPEAAGRPFLAWRNELRVTVNGELLLLDRQHLAGTRAAALVASTGGRFACQATLVCVQRRLAGDRLLGAVREALARSPGSHAGATLLADGTSVYVRVAAADADGSGAALRAAWTALRLALTGAAPAARRK